ncbi:MAG: CoA ester lyase [Candidatus Tectimicrobiota bacterium]
MVDRIRRSWLIVPAHDSARLDEAAQSGADVVVLDLQDLVHDTKKHAARAAVREAIPRLCARGVEVFVRSDLELLYADLQASVWRGLSGVLLPGVTSVAQVQEADRLLGTLQAERGVVKPPPVGEVLEADDPVSPEQALELHLCLDTGRGNWDAVELIQASPRVHSISLGRADLVMDLREEPSGDLHLLPYLMQRLIIIASATGVQPIGAWWRATSRGLVASSDETLAAALSGRQAGFKGALCVRAHQVAPLNQGFTPSAAELAQVEATQAASAASLRAWAAACARREQGRATVIGQS